MRASVVKNVLEEYINYHNSNYQNITNKRIKRTDIEERIGLSYGRIFGFNLIKPQSFNFNDVSFWGEGNPDVLAVKNQCKSNSHEVSQMITGISPTNGDNSGLFHGISVSSREVMIINILKYKCPELILNRNKNKNKNKNIENYNSILFNSPLKRDKLYIVSDIPTEIINNSKYFHVINYCLLNFEAVALDYNEVLIELVNIKEDSSNGVDQLIGDMY